ncbi:hypothetical protein [Mycolicibacterium sarraceniae]|uniref:Uncharacterized protein n=1 Tax=Mycolicibacterium sarraceniae TaxID=1534348 RepID=A0A7I7SNJ7_9MYCO|nr:hypothetical protein [Mycolicibacterium sarraceniae]BBY58574.1 hypothetical protein MSAR_17100 [Mycolicibacterium sarraceniae]
MFGGNSEAWAAFDPTTVITRHGHFSATSRLFAVSAEAGPPADGRPDLSNPEGQDRAGQTLGTVGSAHGIECSVLALPGSHDWQFAAQAFSAALPWPAGRLSTPAVPAIPVPGAPPALHAPSIAVSSLTDPPAAKPAAG